jgi:hypothetical protein
VHSALYSPIIIEFIESAQLQNAVELYCTFYRKSISSFEISGRIMKKCESYDPDSRATLASRTFLLEMEKILISRLISWHAPNLSHLINDLLKSAKKEL